MTKRLSGGLLLCLALPAIARGGGFQKQEYLDTAPEILVDSRTPLAASSSHVASWVDGQVTVRNKRFELTSQFPFAERPSAMAFTPNGWYLLIGGSDGGVTCVPREGGVPRWKATFKGGAVGSLAPSPDSRFVAVGGASRAALFLIDDGKPLGSLKIKTSGLKGPDGKRLPLLVWQDTKLLAAIESKRVRFVSVDRRRGIAKGDKGEVVKLRGVARSAARLSGLNGLCVGTTKGLLLVRRGGDKPQVLLKTRESGSPVALVAGSRFLAGLSKDRKRIVIFERKGKSLVRRSSRSLNGRSAIQIACSYDGEVVFFVSHPVGDPDACVLDGLDSQGGILRRGALPSGAIALRFEDDGALACVVSSRRNPAGQPQVELWKRVKGRGLVRAHAHSADLLEVSAEICLVSGDDGLQILDRTTGGLSPLNLPAGFVGKDMSLQHRYLIVTGDEEFTIFDTGTGTQLGAWKAMSRRTLAVAPNGAFVVRLVHEGAIPELICEKVGEGVAWKRPLKSGNPDLLISPGAVRLIVSGVEVRDLASGEHLYELTGVAQFSRDGKYVLVDQSDRGHDQAFVLDAETGAVEAKFLWLQAKARIKSCFQLVAIDSSGQRLVARTHKPPRTGLWLYDR